MLHFGNWQKLVFADKQGKRVLRAVLEGWQVPENQSRRLDSWKEIAAYLGRDVRTAIRWEHEKALPVHRVPGGKRHAVFAYTEELHAWLNRAKEQGVEAGRRLWWMWAAAVVAALALALVLVGLLVYYLYRPGEPARVTFAGRKMLVWDERDRLAWQHEFAEVVTWPPTEPREPPLRIVDINGDGRPELLVAPAFADATRNSGARELYCFSETGRLLWRYLPQATVTTPDRQQRGPWHIVALQVVADRGPAQIWASLGQPDGWAGPLIRLDAAGRATMPFINAGVLYVLNHMRGRSGSYLLAGGVNNEYDSGMLAVLQDDQPPASSPQTPDSRYNCRECPPGRPLRYMLFPRSEINHVNGAPYNSALLIALVGDEVRLETMENDEAGGKVSGIYRLSADFDVRSAVWSSSYRELHRRYEGESRIRHTFENCTERVGPRTIRVWDAEHGWRGVPIPQVIRAW